MMNLVIPCLLATPMSGANPAIRAQDDAYGRSLLNSPAQFFTTPAARESHRIEDRTYVFDITEPGPKPWGVQLLWQLPPTGAGDSYHLRFEARGTDKTEMLIRMQQYENPWDLMGMEERVTLKSDWTNYEFKFETLGTYADTALIFMLSSAPGTISIRSVNLRKRLLATAPLLTGSKAKPVRSLADLFRYYDEYIARYRSRDPGAITAA